MQNLVYQFAPTNLIQPLWNFNIGYIRLLSHLYQALVNNWAPGAHGGSKRLKNLVYQLAATVLMLAFWNINIEYI